MQQPADRVLHHVSRVMNPIDPVRDLRIWIAGKLRLQELGRGRCGVHTAVQGVCDEAYDGRIERRNRIEVAQRAIQRELSVLDRRDGTCLRVRHALQLSAEPGSTIS